MANIDYAGLLTGISSQNQRPSPFTSPSRDQQLLGFAAKQNEALTGRLGGMFGQQQQDPVELAKAELQKLNPNDPNQQQRFLKLLKIADPVSAMKFETQLADKNLAASKEQANRKAMTDYVTQAFPDQPEMIPLAEQGLLNSSNLKDYSKTANVRKTQVIQRENVEGVTENILINSDTGADIKNLGVKQGIGTKQISTQVVKRSVNGVLQNVLINSSTGKDIKTIGPSENPDITTTTIKRDVNGREHTVLINAKSGEDIRDLGPAKVEDTNMSTVLDPVTGIEHSVVLDKKGNIINTVGVSKLPSFEVLKSDDGKYQVVNKTLGLLGPKVATEESAQLDQEKFGLLLSQIAAVDNTLATVAEAEGLVAKGGAGWEYFFLAPFPAGTDSRKLANRVETLQGNLAFDKLDAMRKSSPTGGALGQVSNIELGLLKAALTALDPTAGAEELNAQLAKVKTHYTNYKKSLLGQTPAVNFSDPMYKSLVAEKDGVRYMKDPASGTVYNLGKVK